MLIGVQFVRKTVGMIRTFSVFDTSLESGETTCLRVSTQLRNRGSKPCCVNCCNSPRLSGLCLSGVTLGCDAGMSAASASRRRCGQFAPLVAENGVCKGVVLRALLFLTET